MDLDQQPAQLTTVSENVVQTPSSKAPWQTPNRVKLKTELTSGKKFNGPESGVTTGS